MLYGPRRHAGLSGGRRRGGTRTRHAHRYAGPRGAGRRIRAQPASAHGQALVWAVGNFFYQPSLEPRMEKLLERYPNVTAPRGREVIGFSHDDTGVAIKHAASSGTRYGQANATAEAPVGYGCDPRASLDAKTLARLSALGARFVALYPFGGRPQGGAVKRSRGGRADRGGGPWRRRDRVVPRGRREEGPCRPRASGQVRLRPDARGPLRRGREPGARGLRRRPAEARRPRAALAEAAEKDGLAA